MAAPISPNTNAPGRSLPGASRAKSSPLIKLCRPVPACESRTPLIYLGTRRISRRASLLASFSLQDPAPHPISSLARASLAVCRRRSLYGCRHARRVFCHSGGQRRARSTFDQLGDGCWLAGRPQLICFWKRTCDRAPGIAERRRGDDALQLVVSTCSAATAERVKSLGPTRLWTTAPTPH